MNDTLKLLYDRFYTPLPMEEAEQEIDDCHRQLCGFKLAWELSNELNHYKSRHPSRCDKTEMAVCFD